MTVSSNNKSITKGCLGCLFGPLIILLMITLMMSYGMKGVVIVIVIGLSMYLLGQLLRDRERKITYEKEEIENKKYEKATIQLEEFNTLFKYMMKKGRIDRKILEEKYNLIDPYLTARWLGSMDDYIKDSIKLLADEEKKQRKIEEDELLAKSFVHRDNTQRFQQNIQAVNQLFDLSPVEFERWVKVHIFEKEGWVVTETKVTGDGGIDLILYKDDEMSIAQCKRYRGTVGEPLLRDFYGAMTGKGVSRGFFVTTGLYSLSALKFAKDKPIEMIDRRILAQKYVVGK